MSRFFDEEADDIIDPTNEEMLRDMYPDEDSRPGEDEEW